MRLEHADLILERMATTKEPITDLSFGLMLQAVAVELWERCREDIEAERDERADRLACAA